MKKAAVTSILVAVVLLALGVIAEAQQPPRVPRIGYMAAVSASADAPRLEAFRQGLRDRGYIEGQNITIDYRHEARGFEPLPAIAAELIALNPDVLVGVTTNAAQAVKQATTTIPVVFMGVTDPVAGWTGRKSATSWRQQYRNHQHGGDFDWQTNGTA